MAEHDPDADILPGVAAGDRVACAALMARHLPRLLALAERFLNDRAEAEDLTQDVFIKAVNAAGSWEPGRARFSTWLHRVTVNGAMDQLRRRARRPVMVDLDDQPLAEGRPDAEAQLGLRQRREALNAAMAALPPRQRIALALMVDEDMSQREAAAAMEISEEALESLLARARRSLAATLRAKAEEGVL